MFGEKGVLAAAAPRSHQNGSSRALLRDRLYPYRQCLDRWGGELFRVLGGVGERALLPSETRGPRAALLAAPSESLQTQQARVGYALRKFLA